MAGGADLFCNIQEKLMEFSYWEGIFLKSLLLSALMVLFSLGCATKNSLKIAKPPQKAKHYAKYENIKKYLEKAQKFKYKADLELFQILDYWQNPDEIEKNQAGDCEDKSLWLYSKLIGEGYSDIRLVIGKLRVDDKINHMWVIWQIEGETFILDSTTKLDPIKLSDLPYQAYKPLYSYYKNQKWEHIS